MNHHHSFVQDYAQHRIANYQQEAEQARICRRISQNSQRPHILGIIGRTLIAYEQRRQHAKQQRALSPIFQERHTGHLHA